MRAVSDIQQNPQYTNEIKVLEISVLAKERNVWGVAKLFGHCDLEAIANLPGGLQFGRPKVFRSTRKDSINQSRSRTQSSILANALGLSLSTLGTPSSGRKRERQDDWVPPGRTKRSKSDSRRRSVTASAQVNGTGGERRHGVEVVGSNSLTAPEGCEHESFENRIFSCLVILSPSRAIHKFNSAAEFLEACRDFLQAHRSLHFDGKILHRDISDNNLIITDLDHEGDPGGLLIDLDLAKELDGGPSGARHRTGTMESMAIEVLEGRSHTYHHDL